MATDLTIRAMTNREPGFYPLLGPFLARREVVQEIGGPIWDDDGKIWFVALDEDGLVAGFCAARDMGRYVSFTSDYVLPEHRNRGVYKALFAERMRHYRGRQVRAVCRPGAAIVYAAYGFRQTGETKEFVRMRRDDG